MKLFLGLIIPFIGTILGSSMVFLMREKVNKKIEIILAGLSGGIMISSSIWSLIIPSINISNSMIPTIIGIIIGVIFLKVLNKNISKGINGTNMMVLAVTLHNIPEGMAVGVSLAGSLNGVISISCALILSLGIAIQNFPEGAIISMPLKGEGCSKQKAFIYGTLSGIVEPIAGVITLFLTNIVTCILSYILSFAAGAMIYVVIKELLPDFKRNTLGILSFIIGFLIMMILDILL